MDKKNGTLILSLDFELLWGVRDFAGEVKARSLLATRQVVPRLLDIFQKYGIHATWATVGFLFFESRAELLAALPDRKPSYKNRAMSPYEELAQELGEDEQTDPLHYAPSLIRRIIETPHQELATHTFSHYYCLEGGQSTLEFESDLRAALRAADRFGCTIHSIVFPRNQYHESYLEVCARNGILAFRGTESVWFRQSRKRQEHRQWHRRLARLSDAYLNISGANTYPIPAPDSLPVNLPASRYLRSWSRKLRVLEPLRLKRILNAMTAAAQAGEVFHLWWHPEDFSEHMDENLNFLSSILSKYRELNQAYGMQSRTMEEAARSALDKSG